MTDPHHVRLADYLQEREIDAHITVEQEDSVREDWWRAGCMVHDWYTTGSKDTVEGAAAMHVADDHLACSAPADRTFIGVPLYCHLEPDHDGDEHANGGYTWPRTAEEKAAAEQPGTPNDARHRCPLSSCSWHFDTSPMPVVAAEYVALLIDYFGPDGMMREAANWHRYRIERALEKHINAHTNLELAAEIVKQQALIIELRSQLATQLQPVMINTDAATKIVITPTAVDEA